jgi:hypothetical protein
MAAGFSVKDALNKNSKAEMTEEINLLDVS